MIVAADEAAESLRERVDDAFAGDPGRYDDKGTVAAVFAEAVRPRDAGVVERFLQELVELVVQVKTDLIITVRPGEADDVDGEQDAHLAVNWRRRRLAQ